MEEKQNKDKINSDFVNRQILLTNSNNMFNTYIKNLTRKNLNFTQ